MNDTIKGIENNKYKNKIREAICNQAVNVKKVASLCAVHCHFEKMLKEFFPTSNIHCFEIDPQVYNKAMKECKKNGFDLHFQKIGDAVNADDADFDFAFFDYCGNPYGGKKWGFSRIEEPAQFIRNAAESGKSAMCYVTYCMTSRTMTQWKMTNELLTAKMLNQKTTMQSIQEERYGLKNALLGRLFEEIGIAPASHCTHLSNKEKAMNEKVHFVFDVSYLGGKRMKTPMLTLGFQIGKKTVKPFAADWTEEIRNARPTMAYKGTKKTIKAPKAEIHLATTWKQAVRDLFDKGWTGKEISTLINKTRNQVGAVLARHKHPESFRNSVFVKDPHQ